jgi:hypothetical protein
MGYGIYGESCSNGPCPTLHRDPLTGDVKVQGYATTADDLSKPLPPEEDVVFIPQLDWARLLADVPIRELLRAMVAPWRFRNRRAAAATAARR